MLTVLAWQGFGIPETQIVAYDIITRSGTVRQGVLSTSKPAIASIRVAMRFLTIWRRVTNGKKPHPLFEPRFYRHRNRHVLDDDVK